MKLLVQPFMPICTPGNNTYALVAGDFYVDDDNLVGNHAYGTLVIRRAEVAVGNMLPDDFDLSTLPDDVLILR